MCAEASLAVAPIFSASATTWPQSSCFSIEGFGARELLRLLLGAEQFPGQPKPRAPPAAVVIASGGCATGPMFAGTLHEEVLELRLDARLRLFAAEAPCRREPE